MLTEIENIGFLKEYYDDTVGKLERYDAQNDTDYTKIFYIFLQENGNYIQTSQKLYIHRNTLIYKINKIQEIIKRDLTDTKVRLEFYIGYLIKQINDFIIGGLIMGEIKKLKFFANGKWQNSKTTKYMDIFDPSTGEVIAQAPCCTEEEVDMAIKSAKDAFPSWSDTPVIKRIQVVYKFRDLLEKNMEELINMCATENGKTLAEAKGDIIKIKEQLNCM